MSQEEWDEARSKLHEVAKTIDVYWLLINSCLVLFMQAGFTLLEVGNARIQNAFATVIKNVGDSMMSFAGFFLIGYSIAFGRGSLFFGFSDFLVSESKRYEFFFFQATFAATATTIVSGTLIERTSAKSYLIFSVIMSSFIYPVIVHWIWSDFGWLSPTNPEAPFFPNGALDFAGGGPVHICGGVAGLVGAWMLGPRIGWIDNSTGKINRFEGHSVMLRGLGCFILWFGWYGFNCGSTIHLVGLGDVVAIVAINTLLATCYGGLTAMILSIYLTRKIEVDSLFNGSLAGLVAITAGAAHFEIWNSAVCGVGAAMCYIACSRLIVYLRIDDPLEAISVHGAGGTWSIISASLFASHGNRRGAFFGNPNQFPIALLEIVSVICWSGTMSFIAFKLIGRVTSLRPKLEEEDDGLDDELERAAYPELQHVMDALDSVAALQKLIDNPKKARVLWLFHAYLQREFDAAPLNFLVVAKAYMDKAKIYLDAVAINAKVIDKKSLSEYREEVRKLFIAICDKYIFDPTSESNLTFPENQKRFVLQFYQVEEIAPANVFELLAEEQRETLQSGSFKRFLKDYEAARKTLVERRTKKGGHGDSTHAGHEKKRSSEQSSDLEFWKAALDSNERVSTHSKDNSREKSGPQSQDKTTHVSARSTSSPRFIIHPDANVVWKGDQSIALASGTSVKKEATPGLRKRGQQSSEEKSGRIE